MTRYRGLTRGDTISRGGAFVKERGFGSEIFNFLPFAGRVFGYAQPHGRKSRWDEATINIRRLGAPRNAAELAPVHIIWVATAPSGGAFIVGWYLNATVYENMQTAPAGSKRLHEAGECGYFVTARDKDAVLLPPDKRVFPIPQKGKGNFGQSNVWYADASEHGELRKNVLAYVTERRLPKPYARRTQPHNQDHHLRQRIELIAVDRTTQYFETLGYEITSFERDNVGWDLSALLGRRELKLEVKGLSGRDIVVELTPNEYKAMCKHRSDYRVCVVSSALRNPMLSIFAFSEDSAQWETEDRQVMHIKEFVGARCSSATTAAMPRLHLRSNAIT